MIRNRDTAAQNFLNRQPCETGTVWTDRNAIYSYGSHFPMAVFNDDGHLWVNEAKYSATTSQHQSALRSALTRANYKPTDDTDAFSHRHSNVYAFRRWSLDGK